MPQFKKIVVAVHANSNALWFSINDKDGILSSDNISQININVCIPNRTIKIVGCNAWLGSNSIAQKLATQINESVEAPISLVSAKIWVDWKEIVWGDVYTVWESFKADLGWSALPTIGGGWKFNTFNP